MGEWWIDGSDGGGTRCGKELTAWLGGDCGATDAARCCGRVAARSLGVFLYLDVTSHIKNMMQGHKWNADVSSFEVAS